MTDHELMQQALDALKVMRPACFAENTLKTADAAITALRDRLAQPEQEPVAWYHAENYKTHFTTEPSHDLIGKYWQPLYTTPQQRQWVGLTDEDRQELAAEQHSWEGLCFAVEKKLKDKNL
jgi:hypothetical protein